METCHTGRPRASRLFIITPYWVTEGGEFVPEIPRQCRKLTEEGGSACSIRVHDRRWRKTGPEYPLVVAKCATHRVAFTLYPPGYVPYGRVAMAPVDSEGQLVSVVGEVDVEGEGPEGRIPGQLTWDTTIFRAARDADRRRAWPRECRKDGPGSWRTQGRWIAMAAACLGLTGGDREHWPLVGLLGIPGLVWREARADYASAGGYVARGRAIMVPLEGLSAAGCPLLDRLLAGGLEAGCWGEPRRWYPSAKALRRLVRLPRPP
ncbi:hypothetical protein ACFL5O_06365 [Myxococcota bacterium]